MRSKDKYAILLERGKLHGSLTRARKLAKQRKDQSIVVDRLTLPLLKRLQDRKILLELGGNWGQEVRDLAHQEYPRRRRWRSAEPSKDRWLHGWTIHTETGTYSRRCTYTKFDYTPLLTSYAIILSPRTIRVRVSVYSHLFHAPHGYHWNKDLNGLRLVANANNHDDYHPTASHLIDLAGQPVEQAIRDLVASIRENATMRRLAAKEARERLAVVKRAEAEGATVCMRDSLRAGNCYAGTASWALRHGLEPNQHYRPSEVLAFSNGDTGRVAIVVAVALRRHAQEMRQGYCVRADHWA